MSLYSAGADSFTGGAVAGAADTPVTTSWQKNMQGAAQKIRDKYGDAARAFTVAEVLPDVNHWWEIATKFATEAGSLSTMTPDRLKKAQANATDLLEQRSLLRQRQATDQLSRAELDASVSAMIAPIEWLVAVGKPVLEQEERPGFPWRFALYATGAVAALWALARVISSTSELKREIAGSEPVFNRRRLEAPAHQVSNPPAWAHDAELWEAARVAVEPYAARYDNPMAVTTHVYKQMGGRVG